MKLSQVPGSPAFTSWPEALSASAIAEFASPIQMGNQVSHHRWKIRTQKRVVLPSVVQGFGAVVEARLAIGSAASVALCRGRACQGHGGCDEGSEAHGERIGWVT